MEMNHELRRAAADMPYLFLALDGAGEIKAEDDMGGRVVLYCPRLAGISGGLQGGEVTQG